MTKVATAIIGSRNLTSYIDFLYAIKPYEERILSVISGGALGVDSNAKRYAKERGLLFQEFPANWDLYGKDAGFIRNRYIIENCKLCIALWDGKSSGTQHGIKLAKQMNKELIIIQFPLEENPIDID